MSTSPPPDLTPDLLNALYADLFDDYSDIRQIAERHNLSLLQLASLLAAEPIRSHLASLSRLFRLRSRLLVRDARPAAIAKLRAIVLRRDNDETARRAAVNLLQLSRMLPVPRTPSPGSMRFGVPRTLSSGSVRSHTDLAEPRSVPRPSTKSL